MYESISNEMNNKLGMANLQGQNQLNKTQQMMNGVSALGDAVTKGMSVYAQSTWNKDKYDLRQKLIAGQEDFLNVDNENASNDYAAWADKQMEDYVSQKSPMIRGLLNEQKQEFIDDARASFDTQLINRIDDRNKLNAMETWDKAIQAFTENPDGMDLFEMKDVYSTTVGNDGIKVTHEKVKIGNLFDTESEDLTDKQKNFNKLLNVLYESQCLVTDQDSAKAYVMSKIPDIEDSLITNDIAMLSNDLVNDQSMTSEKSIVDSISSMYLAGFDKTYTGEKISAAEADAYRKTAESYVNRAWNQAQEATNIRYNNEVLPTIAEMEKNGGYVTTDVFNEAMKDLDPRFTKTIRAKWDVTLTTNDAMKELEDWFDNDTPMSNNLSSYAKNFVTYDLETKDWVYTSGAGYLLSSGLYDRSKMIARNMDIAQANTAEGNELMLGYESNMMILYDFIYDQPKEGNPIQIEFENLIEGKDLTPTQEEAIRQQVINSHLNTNISDKYRAGRLGAENQSEVLERVKNYENSLVKIQTSQTKELLDNEKEADIAEGKEYLDEYTLLRESLIQFGTPDQREDNEVQKLIDHTLGENATPEEKARVEEDAKKEIEDRADTLEVTMKGLGVDLTDTKNRLDSTAQHAERMTSRIESIKEAEEAQKKKEIEAELIVTDHNLSQEAIMYALSNENINCNTKGDSSTNTAMVYAYSYASTLLGENYKDILPQYMGNDPLEKGLSDERIAEIQKYADDNDVDYWSAYIATECDNEGDEYKVYYKLLTACAYASGRVGEGMSPTTAVQSLYTNGRSYWYDSFNKRCEQYENDVGVFNGSLVEIEGDNGETVYLPTSLGSSKSSSSTSSKSTSVQSAQTRVDDAKDYINETTNNNRPYESVPGTLHNLICTVGKRDEDGNLITLADVRNTSLYMDLTEDEKETVDWYLSSDAGEEILGSINRTGALEAAIKNNSANDVAVEYNWMVALNYIREKYDPSTDNASEVISNAISFVTDAAVGGFLADMKSFGNNLDSFIGAGGGISNSLLNDLKSDGRNRVKGDDTIAKGLLINDKVDRYINQGVTKGTGVEGLSMFAGEDYAKMKEKDIADSALKVAFSLWGHEGWYKEGLDFDKQMRLLDDKIYDANGEFKNTDDAYSVATELYKIKNTASQLIECSSIMKELENADYNLGHVVAVHGNTYEMSSGVKVEASYDGKNNRLLKVVSVDGQTKEDVRTFMSKRTLEDFSNTINGIVMNDPEFCQYKYAYNSGISLYRDENGELQPTSVFDMADDHNRFTEWGYMYDRGYKMTQDIDWSQYTKFNDGQVDKEWAAMFNYAPPTLYSGSSMNGLDFNYRITTNSMQTYTSEAPRSAVSKIAEAAGGIGSTAIKQWWTNFWSGLSGFAQKYTISGAKNKDKLQEFTEKTFGGK